MLIFSYKRGQGGPAQVTEYATNILYGQFVSELIRAPLRCAAFKLGLLWLCANLVA